MSGEGDDQLIATDPDDYHHTDQEASPPRGEEVTDDLEEEDELT